VPTARLFRWQGGAPRLVRVALLPLGEGTQAADRRSLAVSDGHRGADAVHDEHVIAIVVA